MRFKYNHGGETYELAVAETKLTSPTGVVRHNNANNYVPLINPADKNASHLRVQYNGVTRAPIRYFDEPINMLNGRTLADVKAIFQSGLGKYYFKAGDYFDVTFAGSVTLEHDGVIDAGSTWRVVCLGIDHNPELEGYNRGHFAIGRNTDNVEIAFSAIRMNNSGTNAGGWGACAMRTFLNSTFYDALPSELKAVISPCTKYTDNVGGGSNVADNVTATVDNLWLLAVFEVGAKSSYTNSAEKNFQQKYEYYANGASLNRHIHSKLSDDANSLWWLRSPSTTGTRQFKTARGKYVASGFSPTFVPCFTIGGDSD